MSLRLEAVCSKPPFNTVNNFCNNTVLTFNCCMKLNIVQALLHAEEVKSLHVWLHFRR